ncbi:hypothetical protein GXW74_14645 [Roseomonas eburnea]|uniref:DUF3592 domain-containing protein n=1 Tax=Neoroseomonas eburnea TaxID=1346889 RepID=A0A9X9XDE4_9PROT|nr:DUF3592 domain-containing protein [Neoroseomonas eburnea]MBR0681730.1 hypothetical protein [Neoroseomonas eburnea]
MGPWTWILGALVLLAIALPAAIMGPNLLRSLQERRIRAHGMPATAVVVGMEETGRRFGIELVPELVIHFEVRAQGRPPWRASIVRIPGAAEVPFFMPGRTFEVRYDPAHPERVAVMP